MTHRILIIALLLGVSASGSAQSSTAERNRERERERVEREREREQERREREEERRERDRRRESAGTLDTVVAFDARGTVSVNCSGGTIAVTAGERNEIRVRARTGSGDIRFTVGGGRATLEPALGRGCNDNGRFELVVPAGTRVSATTWSGSVSVRGVQGEVEINAQSGDVEVRDAGERVDVTTLSGDIIVQRVKGDAAIRSVSGDVQLDAAGGEVEVESVSGDLELRGITSRQVRAQTTSGDVSFVGEIVPAGRYEFTTHSGEVRLELPAGVGAQLSVSTFSGSIDSAFPITLRPGDHGIGASSSKRLSFTLGAGTARILAETFSGDITLLSMSRRP